jgi:cytochrome b subunit of formate dehydrogenase
MIFVSILDQYLGTRPVARPRTFVDSMWIVSCILLAGSFVLMTWRFVVAAEYRVSILERTKHWRNEPKHPRWSEHARAKRRRKQIDDDED